MITSKDVREEIKIAEDVLKKDNRTTVEMLKVIIKLITVAIKVGLSTRTNSKLIMSKVGAEKLESRKREENGTRDTSKDNGTITE